MTIAIIITLLLAGTLIVLNERFDLLSCDVFPTVWHRASAYATLTILVFVISTMVISSSQSVAEIDLEALRFIDLFGLHLILLIFLALWWLLTARPSLPSFFNIDIEKPGEGVLLGIGVGVGGWAVTIGVALVAGLIVTAAGVSTQDLQPSPMIPWMVSLAWWKKGLIVLSAMTVEELFFRGWLQKRIGLLASTLIFAVSHAGYGQPFMLIGVTTISLVIGFTFYKTRNLVPCIIAHGVFDAIQIFLIVPFALKFAPVS